MGGLFFRSFLVVRFVFNQKDAAWFSSEAPGVRHLTLHIGSDLRLFSFCRDFSVLRKHFYDQRRFILGFTRATFSRVVAFFV